MSSMATPSPAPAPTPVLNNPSIPTPQLHHTSSAPEAPSQPQEDDFNYVYVSSDAICLQTYQELETRPRNAWIQFPILTRPQSMTIGDLLVLVVTEGAAGQAKKLITSPGLQKILEPSSSFNPHRLSIRDTSDNWYSLIGWAAKYASVEMLQCMFTPQSADQKVFDVNFVDWFGFTALECALQIQVVSQVPKIEYLLGHPDIRTSLLRPLPLQYAVQYGRVGSAWGESIVETFLENGANVDLTGSYYGTYFEAACFFSSSALIYKLISKSTSMHTSLNSGGAKYGSILQAAACLGRLDVVEHLLTMEEIEVNQTGGVYGSPLAAAAKGCWSDQRDSYTTDLNTKAFWHFLVTVSRHGDALQKYLEILEALIKHGAIVAKGQLQGIFHSSVAAAVCSLCPPILELILKNDIDPGTERDCRHSEALIGAAFMSALANTTWMLEMLISSGHGDPNYGSKWLSGFYPLELAVFGKNLANVNCLLQKGADPYLEGGLGGALRAAIFQLPNQGSAVGSPIADLIMSYMDLKSPKIVARDSQYCNILHMAVFYGRIDVVQTLLKNDVRCDVKDLGQRTVLHIATLQGNTEMIKVLLESGRLDDELIEAEDAWGRTASQIVEEEDRKARDGAGKSELEPYSWTHKFQASQKIMQWSEIRRIMKPLEDKALADHETRHNRGVRFLGPRSKGSPELRLASAKPVTTISPRGSGLGFQATIVDFSIDGTLNCEAHQIRHPLIDEILYSSSPREIMTRKDPLTTPINLLKWPLSSTPAVHSPPKQSSAESPEYIDPKFRWIHLPTNNMAWVEDLVNNIRQRQETPAPAISRELWGVDLQSTSPGSAPHTNSITPQCKLLTADIVSVTKDPSKRIRPFFMSLPYIHWERCQGQENMNRILEGKSLDTSMLPNGIVDNTARIQSGETAFEADDPSDTLLTTYAGKSPPLHIRRTLDQYYYSKLKDTQVRDRDQVVNRARDENLKVQYLAKNETNFPRWAGEVKQHERSLLQTSSRANPTAEREESNMEELTQAIKDLDEVEKRISGALSEISDENVRRVLHATLGDSPIIMVDQLWLWVLDDETVITSFSPRRNNVAEPGIAQDLAVDPEMRIDPKNRTDILRSIAKHLRTTTRDPVLDPRDLVEMIISQCLGILLDHKNRLEELDFLTTFSTQTASVLDKTAKLLNLFVKTFERYGNKSEIPGDVFETIFSVTKETLLFREVQDIRDELGMLSALFQDQLGVLSEAGKVLYHEELAGVEGLDAQMKFQIDATPLGLVRARVMKHWKDVERMEGQAKQAYEMLKDLLDLKQQQANVLEARQSRKQAVIAAKQGKVVLVFTVVTIVFLPLTFMTTIFTLNVSTFPRETVPATAIVPASTTLNGRYVFPLIVGVTIAMAVPLVIIAFNVDVMSARISRSWLYKRLFEEKNGLD